MALLALHFLKALEAEGGTWTTNLRSQHQQPFALLQFGQKSENLDPLPTNNPKYYCVDIKMAVIVYTQDQGGMPAGRLDRCVLYSILTGNTPHPPWYTPNSSYHQNISTTSPAQIRSKPMTAPVLLRNLPEAAI
jgi:hypothetical protein